LKIEQSVSVDIEIPQIVKVDGEQVKIEDVKVDV